MSNKGSRLFLRVLSSLCRFLPSCNYSVNHAILQGVFSREKKIPFCVFCYPLKRLSRMLCKNPVYLFANPQNLLCMNLNVCSLPLNAAQDLMKHHAGMRECVSLSLCTRGKKHSSHACGLTDANCRNAWFYVLHSIVHSKPRGDVTTGGVNINVNIFLGIFGF